MNENSVMVPFEDVATQEKRIVDGMSDASGVMYCSFTVDTHEDRVKMYNATTGECGRVKDYVNKEILLKDVIVAPVQIQNDDGTESICPRVTLLLIDGTFLAATSWGVYKGIQRILSIFGTLHFEDGLKMVPIEVKTKSGFTLNFKLV